MRNAYDSKSPLERSVRDMFKAPLEREYRDLITAPKSPNLVQTPSTGTTVLPRASPQYGGELYSAGGPAPPPYRDDSVAALPEKTTRSDEAPSEELERIDSPCDSLGHDIKLSEAERRCRIISLVFCPAMLLFHMQKRRTCKRCGTKVKADACVLH